MALVCTVATTADLDATYSVINQKPTLTMNSTGVLTIDGRDILVGDVILVKDQSSLNQNAVYQCYVRGDTGVAAVLVLYYQFSTLQNINNCGIINVIFGTINQNSAWVINSIITSIGVSNIEFVNLIDPRGLTHANYIIFDGSSGNNTIQFPDNEFAALFFQDASANEYLVFEASTNPNLRAIVTGGTLRTGATIDAQGGPILWGNSTYSTGTAALNLTTVTGSGTTFPTGCEGGVIFWLNEGLYALIVSRDSATQLTVQQTNTTFSTDNYIIYYGGMIVDVFGPRQLANQTVNVNRFKSGTVDLKTPASTSIVTTNANGTNFFPNMVRVYCNAATGFVSAASISVGTNSTSFDNILPITALTGLNASGKYIDIPISAATTAVPPNTAISVKVTTGATTTTQTGIVYVLGDYL
jgi:hypothetical protein